MTTNTPNDPMEPRSYRCDGLRADHNGKPLLVLRRLHNGEPEREMFFDAKVARRFAVGHVYAIPTSADGDTISTNRGKPLGPWSNDREREAIVAAHEATGAALAAKRLQAKGMAADKAMAVTLAPLRQEYRLLRTRDQKVAYELLVLYALRGH